MRRKGQIGILPLIASGITIAMASISGFFYQSNRIGVVETRASVLEVRYEDFDKKLERIDEKLDMILSEKYQKNLGATFASSTRYGN